MGVKAFYVASVLAATLLSGGAYAGSGGGYTVISPYGCDNDTYAPFMEQVVSDSARYSVLAASGDLAAAKKLKVLSKFAGAKNADEVNQVLAGLTSDEKSWAAQIKADDEAAN